MVPEIPIHEFDPLYDETEETILARLLDPWSQSDNPDRRFNTAEGSWLYDFIEPITLEFLRIYERLNQVVGIGYVVGAFGDYLDQKGVELDTPRKAASFSTVTLTIEGEIGTIIPAGTRFTTPASGDEDEIPPEFATNEEVTIPAAGYVSVEATATLAGLAGNVAARTITMMVDVIDGVIAVSNPGAAGGGDDVEGDDEYRFRLIEALQAAFGAGNIFDYSRWAKEITGVDDAIVTPLWDGPGTVKVTVFGPSRSITPVAVTKEVQEYIDPSVVTLAAFEGGEGWVGGLLVETTKDEGNTSLELAAPTNTTISASAPLPQNLSEIASGDNFEAWIHVVSGLANLGTVRVALIDTNGAEAYYSVPTPASTLVNGEQRITWQVIDMVVPGGFLWSGVEHVKVVLISTTGGPATIRFDTVRYRDGDGGRGQGQAPIGAQVTVSAARSLLVNVAVTVTPRSGYTVPSLTPIIQSNLEAHFLEREIGEYVYLTEIANVIHDTDGVRDFTGLTLNGVAANLVVADVEVPVLGTLTVS